MKCYTGDWPEGSTAHPEGGKVGYTTIAGTPTVASHIWSGHRRNILYLSTEPIYIIEGAREIDCSAPNCNLYAEDECQGSAICCADGTCQTNCNSNGGVL